MCTNALPAVIIVLSIWSHIRELDISTPSCSAILSKVCARSPWWSERYGLMICSWKPAGLKIFKGNLADFFFGLIFLLNICSSILGLIIPYPPYFEDGKTIIKTSGRINKDMQNHGREGQSAPPSSVIGSRSMYFANKLASMRFSWNLNRLARLLV